MAMITYISSNNGELELAKQILQLPQRYRFALAETPFNTILISDADFELNKTDIEYICEALNECDAANQYKAVTLTDGRKITVSI